MKPFLAAGLFAATAASVTAAQAQSTITVAGTADSALRSVNNEGRGTVRSVVSGSNSTSKLIFRGTEDLGGGLSAGFWLEHGLALDTGTATGAANNQMWDRRSTLSLVSKQFGEVRLGRDYMPTYLNWVRFDPFTHVGVAGSNNAVTATGLGPIRSAFGTGLNTTVRADNSLQYWLPANLGGLEGQILVAPQETSNNRVVSGRLGYTFGPAYVAASRAETRNATTASTGKFTDTLVGGSYTFEVVKLSAMWRQFRQNASKQTNTVVAAVVPVGNGEIKASWIRINLAGRVGATVIDANDARQLGLGYVHNLSKRTALYATASRISNDGAATYSVPGGPTVTAGGRNSTGYEAGLRHNF